jgi:hypothetical protein
MEIIAAFDIDLRRSAKDSRERGTASVFLPDFVRQRHTLLE